jgi:hypothetical protein
MTSMMMSEEFWTPNLPYIPPKMAHEGRDITLLHQGPHVAAPPLLMRVDGLPNADSVMSECGHHPATKGSYVTAPPLIV